MADAHPNDLPGARISRGPFILAAIASIVLLLIAVIWWRYSASHPSTDDASLQAYYVWISPQVAGLVVEKYVEPNQFVKAGQPLFKIDPRPFEQKLAEAEAHLTLARYKIPADQQAVDAAYAIVKEQQDAMELVQEKYDRLMPLVDKQVLDQLTGVQITSTLLSVRAALAEANFRLNQASLNLGDPAVQKARLASAAAAAALARLHLEWTVVKAPADGYVTQFNLRVGDYLEPGDNIFPFVESGRWWVQANFKENQVGRIRPGMRARVTVGMYPGRTFNGIVESLSVGSASFSPLPPQNTTGSDLKITQRIPVRIDLEDPTGEFPFRTGASAKVTIDATRLPGPPIAP